MILELQVDEAGAQEDHDDVIGGDGDTQIGAEIRNLDGKGSLGLRVRIRG